MPYATADRIGRIEGNPQPKVTGHVLASGNRIFAHTLVGILASNGQAVKLTDANKDALSFIGYTDCQLADDQFNQRVHAGQPYGVSVDVLSGITVFLDAVGLTSASEGKHAVFTDDHTIEVATEDPLVDQPYVGVITKVYSATYASVFIPGAYSEQ